MTDLAFKKFNISSLSFKHRNYIWCLIFILPQVVMFIIFTVYPVITNMVYSLFEWPGYGPLDKFVQLENYIDALSDPYFWKAVKATLVYALGQMTIQLPLALLMAIILNDRQVRGRYFYRAAYFLPSVTTSAVVGIIMTWIFASFNGVVNTIFVKIGLLEKPFDWLGDIRWTIWVVILVGVWSSFGVKMIYWLAGLQSIPDELYDAAKVDGATWLGTLRYITLPLLKTVAIVVVLISSRGALHMFDLVKTMTAGGPAFTTQTVDMFVYRYAFEGTFGSTRMGYAAAVSVLFSIAVIGVGIILTQIRRNVESE